MLHKKRMFIFNQALMTADLKDRCYLSTVYLVNMLIGLRVPQNVVN